MKTRLSLLICILFKILATGCSSDNEYTYTLVYEIYWNGNYIERKTVTSGEHITFGSFRGTNVISTVENGRIEETSAPIRKVSYTKSRKNENRSNTGPVPANT